MSHSIYVVRNTINGKRYIGQSVNPEHRRKCHFAPGANRSILSKAIRKHGASAFKFRVILTGATKSEADVLERAMISRLGTILPNGYNVLPGGDCSSAGWKMSADGRRKMSETRKGRPVSTSWRANISSSLKGRHLSESCKQKLSAALSGRTISDDVRKRMAEGQRNRWTPELREVRAAAGRARWADKSYRRMMLDARARAV